MSQIFSKKLMLCVFLLQIGHLFAQDFNYTFKEYNWEETTQYPTEIVNKYTQYTYIHKFNGGIYLFK